MSDGFRKLASLVRPSVLATSFGGGALLFAVQGTILGLLHPVLIGAATVVFYVLVVAYVATRTVEHRWFPVAVINIGVGAILGQIVSRPVAILLGEIATLALRSQVGVAWESPMPHLSLMLIPVTFAGVVVIATAVGLPARYLMTRKTAGR